MADMTKTEFMNRLTDREKFDTMWDWFQRLEEADQRLGGMYYHLQGRVTAAELKAQEKGE